MHPATSSHWGLNQIKTGWMMMASQQKLLFETKAAICDKDKAIEKQFTNIAPYNNKS